MAQGHIEFVPQRAQASQKIERKCVALVETLGLHFGAIDMILTPDGRYVFLEINPNGQWTWIEDLTGMPISASFFKLGTKILGLANGKQKTI